MFTTPELTVHRYELRTSPISPTPPARMVLWCLDDSGRTKPEGMDMAPQADVAVIIPNYNKEDAARVPASVHAQTHRPAGDRGRRRRHRRLSGDRAELRAGSSSWRATTGRRPGTSGPRATAPLLFFLDSDTALAPDAIANAVRAYQDTPGAGMVQGVYAPEPLYDDGLVEQYRVAFEHFDRRQSTATFLSNTLIPKQVFFEAGGLDERLRDGEDFEFGTRVPAHYRLVVTESVVTWADDVDGFWACLWERFVGPAPSGDHDAGASTAAGRQRGFRLDMIRPRHARASRPDLLHAGRADPGLLAGVAAGAAAVVIWARLLVAFLVAVAVNLPFIRFCRQLRGHGSRCSWSGCSSSTAPRSSSVPAPGCCRSATVPMGGWTRCRPGRCGLRRQVRASERAPPPWPPPSAATWTDPGAGGCGDCSPWRSGWRW